MKKLRDFVAVYKLYRRSAHNPVYAARIAFGMAFLNLPF